MKYPIVITILLGLVLSLSTGLAESQRENIENQIAALQARISSNKTKIGQIDKAIETLGKKKSNAGAKELKQIVTQIDAYQQQKKQLMKTIKEMQTQLDKYQRQLQNLKE